MSWLDQARELSAADVAAKLGFEVRRGPSAAHTKCPACGAERRHSKSRDRRGAVGIPHKTGGWRCFTCDVGGDAIDFAAHVLTDRRFRDLDADGRKRVQEWFTTSGGVYDLGSAPARRLRPARALPPAFENAEVNYPPLGEVEALWESCVPVTESDRVMEYFARRAIVGAGIGDMHEYGVARALGANAQLPSWAAFGGKPWSASGHELIVGLYDFTGLLRAVLARSVEREPIRKSVAANGYGRRGLVLAGRLGQCVLGVRAGAYEIAIYEGEINMLRAYASGLERDQRTACFGIISGSWTRDVAARVPSGTVVRVRTDDDEQGKKYAQAIVDSLGNRARCEMELEPND